MIKYLKILISLILIPVLISCSETIIRNCTKGSKNIIYESRKLSLFHSINMRISGNIFISQNQSDTLLIESDDNIIPLIVTDVKNEKLTVLASEPICPTTLNILAKMNEIKNLDLSGSGNFTCTDSLTIDDMSVMINGSGNVNLYGTANKIISELDGSGNIELMELKTDSANVLIDGSGNIRIFATKYLKAVINGSGNIYYKGNPEFKELKINGSGNIINVP